MLKKCDRLTEKDKNGTVWPVWLDKSIPCGQRHLLEQMWCREGGCSNEQCDFRRIIDRLADYEDSRMTPLEVRRMKEKVKNRRNRVMSSD